jgi:parallel beta-helix repeat protein
VTVIGSGMGKTILDFHGQKQGDDALFAQSVQNRTFQGFTVEDSPGNASRVLSVIGLTFRQVEVKWTASDSSSHGAYGLYPVQSQNVLIEGCAISGASDSGIYVGQSQQIVVRNNEAFQNVAGIEIENSFFADVYGNDSHGNTAGILVFDLTSACCASRPRSQRRSTPPRSAASGTRRSSRPSSATPTTPRTGR